MKETLGIELTTRAPMIADKHESPELERASSSGGQKRTGFFVDLVQTALVAALASVVISSVFWLIFTLGSLMR